MTTPGLYDGLKQLFADYSIVTGAGATPVERLAHYDTLGDVAGGEGPERLQAAFVSAGLITALGVPLRSAATCAVPRSP